MTSIRPLPEFGEEIKRYIETKDHPDKWYLLVGDFAGEYSVHTDESLVLDEEIDVPPDMQAPTPSVEGFYQIGTSGWPADGFTDDCGFVNEFSGGDDSKLDARLLHMLVVHEDMLTEKALALAHTEDHPPEAEP